MPPRVGEHPGGRPTERMATVDSTKSSAPAAHVAKPSEEEARGDDTIEAHYTSLERGIPCYCYGGYHYVGHMAIGEDGEEVEVFEAVPCRRCADSR